MVLVVLGRVLRVWTLCTPLPPPSIIMNVASLLMGGIAGGVVLKKMSRQKIEVLKSYRKESCGGGCGGDDRTLIDVKRVRGFFSLG